MKVILRKDVEHLGNVGELLEVKPGYARNYLIPQGIALIANEKNMKRLEEEQRQQEIKKDRDKIAAEKLSEELSKVSCTASVQVGEEDKVFGSITSQDIAELLKEKGFDVDKKKIIMEEPIKALGIYDIPIKLHTDVEAKIKVWVVKD
ncbi:MAG: 50S ribosomal protein L9 [candidate division KSB1 bacterium]|jgi:large subunit ribosomal protein L9|nr:50S ribosomal protein L9 [candidate division KSB1 bacterium]